MAMFNDFGLTDEQKMMRESLLRLAARTLPAEKIRALDRESGWPHEAYQALAQSGWLGLIYPEEYGGLGGSYKDLVVLLETLSYHYACLGTTYMTSPIYAGLQVLHNGSEELRRDYMVPMLRGELYFAFALTEPQTGSDAASIQTHARRDGGDYVLNGQKWFITSAHVADWLVVVVKTDPAAEPAHKVQPRLVLGLKAREKKLGSAVAISLSIANAWKTGATSWTRTAAAPLRAAARQAATVPPTRSDSLEPSTEPMNRFREGPTRTL